MYKHFIVFCILISTLTSAPAIVTAQVSADESAHFQSYLTMSAYLKSKGVEPAHVNWMPIDKMCIGVKQSSGEPAFNQCKYEKARDQHIHRSDLAQCGMRAQADYPDRLTEKETTVTLQEVDASGKLHHYNRIVHPIPKNELVQKRQAAVAQCMQSLGWVSADNPLLGKRCD